MVKTTATIYFEGYGSSSSGYHNIMRGGALYTVRGNGEVIIHYLLIKVNQNLDSEYGISQYLSEGHILTLKCEYYSLKG